MESSLLLVIKYLFQKNNLTNNDESIESFYENGISFPQFVQIIVKYNFQYFLEKKPTEKLQKLRNNEISIRVLLKRKCCFLYNPNIIFPIYKYRNDTVNLIKSILRNVVYPMSHDEILKKCSNILDSNVKNNHITSNLLIWLLFVLTENGVEYVIDPDYNTLKKSFEKFNIPFILLENSFEDEDDTILLIQIQIIFEFFAKKIFEIEYGSSDGYEVFVKSEEKHQAMLSESMSMNLDDDGFFISSVNDNDDYHSGLHNDENIAEGILKTLAGISKGLNLHISRIDNDFQTLYDQMLKIVFLFFEPSELEDNGVIINWIDDDIKKKNNFFEIIKFLQKKAKIFEIYHFDDNSFLSFYQYFLNSFFLTKTKRDIINRCVNLLSNKDRSYITNTNKAISTYDTFYYLLKFYIQGNMNFKLPEKKLSYYDMSELFKNCYIPMVINNPLLAMIDDDNILPDPIFYQLQFIFDKLDQSSNNLVEFILGKSRIFNEIKVPQSDVILASIKAKKSSLDKKLLSSITIKAGDDDYSTYNDYLADYEQHKKNKKCYLSLVETPIKYKKRFGHKQLYKKEEEEDDDNGNKKVNVDENEQQEENEKDDNKNDNNEENSENEKLNKSHDVEEKDTDDENIFDDVEEKITDDENFYREENKLKSDNLGLNDYTSEDEINDDISIEFEIAEQFWNPKNQNLLCDNGILCERSNSQSKNQIEKDFVEMQFSINEKIEKMDTSISSNQLKIRSSSQMYKTKFYKIFVYDETKYQWTYNSSCFEQLLNDKQINISQAKSSLIFYINSNYDEMQSLNSYLITGMHPKMEEEKEICVSAFCEKTLSMLNVVPDFQDQLKASIKPIFLFIHIPKEKESYFNINSILIQIYSFLFSICNIAIMILKQNHIFDQIIFFQKIINFSKSVYLNKTINIDQNVKKVFSKKLNLIFLITNENLKCNDNKSQLINKDLQFYQTISSKISHEISFHLINLKKYETFQKFLTNMTNPSLGIFNIDEIKHNLEIFKYFNMSNLYIEIRSISSWKEMLNQIIEQRYSNLELEINKPNKKRFILSKLYKELNIFSPSSDTDFVIEYKRIISKINTQFDDSKKSILIKELNKSSRLRLKKLDKKIKKKSYWTNELIDVINNTHIQFLKDEFLSIIQLISNNKNTVEIYEESIDILEKQIIQDKNKLNEMFKVSIDNIKLKEVVTKCDVKSFFDKGTNYILKETENLKEIEVAIEVGEDLKSVIKQDF